VVSNLRNLNQKSTASPSRLDLNSKKFMMLIMQTKPKKIFQQYLPRNNQHLLDSFQVPETKIRFSQARRTPFRTN
jgi:hypothetical protein